MTELLKLEIWDLFCKTLFNSLCGSKLRCDMCLWAGWGNGIFEMEVFGEKLLASYDFY